MKISGIYKIQSLIKPHKIYIGSTVNIQHRWICHSNDFKKNKHCNKKLQNHYNKYGESDLQYSILLDCDKKDLIRSEQLYIDSYSPYFNICKKAYSCLGIKRSKEIRKQMSDRYKGISFFKGRHHTEKTKELIRSKKVGHKQSKETIEKRILKCVGKKRTNETKLKMSKPHKQYIRRIEVSEINTKTKRIRQYIFDNISNKTQTELAKELNIHQSTISKLLKRCK